MEYALEEGGGDVFSLSALDDFRYGDGSGNILEKDLRFPQFLSELRTWKHLDWVNVLEMYLRHHIPPVTRC